MLNYDDIFDTVFEKYRQQTNRPGYSFGFFSKFRHSCKRYHHIQKLEDDLKKSSDKKSVLVAFLKNPKTAFNNHSFSLYLLDFLALKYPDDGWDNYYPADKKIIFYNGILYRGMRLNEAQLTNIFKNGLAAHDFSKSVNDYAVDTTGSLGISTSKSDIAAEGYATSCIVNKVTGQTIIREGYLLKINYRGSGGIDILETLKARGKEICRWLGFGKQEVNIIGQIAASDIEGAWKVDGNGRNDFVKNGNYKPDNQYQDVASFSTPYRLATCFGQNAVVCR